MGKINIVMTTDANYIVPTMVTISSILSSSKKDSSFHVYILCSHDLDQMSRDMLKKLEKKNSRIEIRFLEINDPQLERAVTTAHIPVASYYRLYISQMLQEERCLYIDGDMIVRGDLSDVYNTDLGNYYAAAVKDLGIQSHMSEYADYACYLGIPSMDNYVNAGFMLFNLKKIREDRINIKMVESICKGYKYMDQDIINKYFCGRIKILPLKYDFFTEYCGSLDERKLPGFSKEELSNIEQNACVMHFTGFFKPWLCARLKINKLWWIEAEKILDKNVYNSIFESAKEFERKSDWQYILELARGAEKIVIFGYSEIGISVAERLLQADIKTIVAFADNDMSKRGKHYQNIPVLSGEFLCSKYPDALYIISSQNGFIHIKKQLNEFGIDSYKIIRYIHKDKTYYARLDENYIEHERMMRCCSE